MPLIDATLPLHQAMAAYDGDPLFESTVHSSIADGGQYNLSRLSMGSHTGTHVDAPSHYLSEGKTVDNLDLDALIGFAMVADVRGRKTIDEALLESAGIEGYQRIIFKTDGGPRLENGDAEQYCSLATGAAELLVRWGVKLVGIDQLSVETHQGGGSPVHHILLQAGVVIAEALRLSGAPAGPCDVMCLPLAIIGGDGAPARVVLRYI